MWFTNWKCLWKYKVKDAGESLGHIMKEPRSFLVPASTEEKCPAQSCGLFEEAWIQWLMYSRVWKLDPFPQAGTALGGRSIFRAPQRVALNLHWAVSQLCFSLPQPMIPRACPNKLPTHSSTSNSSLPGEPNLWQALNPRYPDIHLLYNVPTSRFMFLPLSKSKCHLSVPCQIPWYSLYLSQSFSISTPLTF